MSTRFNPSAKLLCVIQCAAAALLIAACGGSSSTRSATAPAGQSAPNERGPHATTQTHRDVVTRGVITQRPAPGTGAREINDDNRGRAGSRRLVATIPSNPCTLVSRAQAQAIVGRPIDTPVDAPLGPTCIYQPVGTRNLVTLTAELIDFQTIRPRIRNLRRLELDGRTAYCGTYGQPTTFVPLAQGRVLNVTAPCAIGIRFAAKALPRL